ncbi:MAG: protein kinase, partial [Deltaproteobacteria bacterium]|nr:protein kinase [Deltaproteobacteria bacterium]
GSDHAGGHPVGAGHPFETVEGQRYRDLAALGEGGMGRVRLVKDERLGRHVALKIPRTAADQRRLAQEAWVTAQLEHPGIVAVYDAGRDPSGGLYYTMRLVRGRSLEEVLAEHSAPTGGLAARLGVMRHVLAAIEAVAFAHKAGIVHRDLKPQNVMVGEFGETLVVDWGLARPIASREVVWRDAVLPVGLTAETLAGEVVGTPAYMSPEQAHPEGAREVGPPSDVWSLGAILFRVLAGVPPYGGKTTAELLDQARRGAVPALSEVAPEAPRELVAIAQRCLEADPARRYPDAKALARDVAAWLDGRRVEAHAYSPLELLRRLVRAWRVPLMVAGVALVALIVVGVIATGEIVAERDRAVSAEGRAREALGQADANLSRALVGEASRQAALGARPEAEVLASAALELAVRRDDPVTAAASRGLLMRLDGARPERVETRALPDCAPRVIAPEVDRALCLGAELESWALGDGAPTRLWARRLDARSAVFFGGHILIGDAAQRLWVLDATRGETVSGPIAVTQSDRLSAVGARAFAAWGWVVMVFGETDLPTRITLCSRERPLEAATLAGDRVVALCDGGLLSLSDLTGAARVEHVLPFGGRALAASHDGRRVAFASPRGRVGIFDLTLGRVVVAPPEEHGSALELAWTADDQRLVVRGDDLGLSILDGADLVETTRLPRASSRGVRVVASGDLWSEGRVELVRWRLPARDEARVWGRVGQGGVSSLAVGPDGRVAVGRGDGVVEVWDRAARSLGRRTFGDQVVKRVAFAADGRLFASAKATYGITAIAFDRDTASTHTGHFFRRLEPLSSGEVLALSYASPFEIIGPNDTSRTPSGAFIAADADLDARRGEAVVLADGGGRVVRFAAPAIGGDLDLRELGRWPGAVCVAVDGVTVVVTPREATIVELGTRIEVREPTDVEVQGELVAVAGADGQVRVHDLTGRLVATLGGHTERIGQLVTTGDAIFSAGWDGTVRRASLAVRGEVPKVLAARLAAGWGLDVEGALDR